MKYYTVFIEALNTRIILGVFNSPFTAEICVDKFIELNPELGAEVITEVTSA